MLKIQFFCKSDTGLVRPNNEDSFRVKAELGLAILSDGMGGAAAGELASAMFVDAAMEVFSSCDSNNSTDIPGLLQQCFQYANRKVLDHVGANPDHEGMGCTGEVIVFSDDGFALGHVGDSRIYLLRNGRLRQLTKDHSFVQDLIDKGVLSPEEARKHRMRHVITRAVGHAESLAMDLVRGNVSSGDLFLLCSDGLTDMVEDAALHEILSSPLQLIQQGEQLVDAANSMGGHDNITVVLCKVIEHQS